VAGKYKAVKNGIVALVDRFPEPFTMTGHLDNLVWLLWIEDVPAFDERRNAIQIGGEVGTFIALESIL
jgi:hypothetical protein